jgi:Putative Flp pilus-assembly TadE/G-like
VMKLRNESGQVMVMTALFMVVIVGMTAFVVDVGSWFRAQRATQSTVDAAVLAGAQALPGDPTTASSLAISYGDLNGGGIAGANITFASKYEPNDTISIKTTKTAPGLFSKIFGIATVTVGAHASAMVGVPAQAEYVAPIVVNINHPDLPLRCPSGCFGPSYQTTLPLGKTKASGGSGDNLLGAPGAFDLLNLNQNQTNGTVGAPALASWIQNGYSKYLPLGGYFSDPGAKFNSNGQIVSALVARIGTDLLFPVYDTLDAQGENASYHVIAWVGFHLLSQALQGPNGTLSGYFTKVIWQGILPAGGSNNIPDLGAHSVALVD